jgi:DNA-binding LacI/PurR family transcriptional regulator
MMKTVEIKTGVKIQNKQEAIRLAVSEKIRNGEYGEKLPGVRELAKSFSVNVITLRKALSPLVKEGVIFSEKGKGMFIDGKRENCIGIIGCTHERCLFDRGTYFGDVFQGMHHVLEEKHDFFSYQLKQRDRSYRELIRENQSVSGFIVFAPIKEEEKELPALKGKVPFVVVGTTSADKEINSVDSDNYNDSFNAVKQLIDEGKRKILFLSNKMWTRTHDLRYRGYADALEESGIKTDKKMVITENPKTDIFKDKILSLFSSKNPPDAIFAINSYSAVKFLEMKEVNSKKLSLIVYDDPLDFISKFGIEYRVIQQPLYDIGASAMKKLYDLIQKKNVKPEQIMLPSKLISKPISKSEYRNPTCPS